MQFSSGNVFENNTASDNIHAGFELRKQSIDNSLKGNKSEANRGDGFVVESSVGNCLTENESIENKGYGYRDNASADSTYVDNVLGGSDPTLLCSP